MIKEKIIAIGIFLFVYELTFAQVDDNFSDGNFTANPPWAGDQIKFIVNAGKLKLQAPAVAETAFLSVSSEAIHNGSWEFYVQMDFNPSSTNYVKIYLVSDQLNLSGSLNGYFVKAGNTSRDISLYRQSGSVETRIIDGADDRLNIPLVKVKIKVIRTGNGVWQLFSDVGPTGSYISEGTFTDNVITTSSFFGVMCTYTSTRSDKFWFDDFAVTGSKVPDTTPPVLQSATALNATQLSLMFSEPLDRNAAENPANFELNGIEMPAVAALQPDQKTVVLSFPSSMKNGLTYSLQVSGIKDTQENVISTALISVLFFQPAVTKYKDILITELFPDPSPQVGLPASEFIEIYNRSQNPVDLLGWKLSDGSSTGIFPSQIMLPGEYRIVSDFSNTNLFTGFGLTVGVTNFPTENNSGDAFTLRNPQGLLIDSVSYTLDTYRDIDKQEGGWTLELIDPDNICGEQDNWMGSMNSAGGTPGKQNSVFANKPDHTGPRLISVFPDSPTRISLTFDEKLDPSSQHPENFILQPSSPIASSRFRGISLRTIELELTQNLNARQLYSVQTVNIYDCPGNLIQENTLRFGLPETPDSMDVIINEILFNPRYGGVDFVEIYNASPKFLNLKNWKLGNFENQIPVGIKTLFSENILFPPESFAVLTSDPQSIKQQYPMSREENLFKTPVPSLPDDEGSAALITSEGQVLDELTYSKSWHSKFIKNDEGVSLERISKEVATNESSNWTSASSHAGYATPGYANSQGRGKSIPEDPVTIIPEIFSPQSGANDFTQIQYHFDRGGWVANVKVYDQQGHYLKTLASNEVLGSDGFFRWDGDRDDGSKARMGYYLIWFEVFDSSGTVNTYRKRVIVAAQ